MIDPSTITGPWPFLALLAVLGVPVLGTWINSRRASHTSARVEKTLTTANGGSHVHDALGRLEQVTAETLTLAKDNRETILELQDRVASLEAYTPRESRSPAEDTEQPSV